MLITIAHKRHTGGRRYTGHFWRLAAAGAIQHFASGRTAARMTLPPSYAMRCCPMHIMAVAHHIASGALSSILASIPRDQFEYTALHFARRIIAAISGHSSLSSSIHVVPLQPSVRPRIGACRARSAMSFRDGDGMITSAISASERDGDRRDIVVLRRRRSRRSSRVVTSAAAVGADAISPISSSRFGARRARRSTPQ